MVAAIQLHCARRLPLRESWCNMRLIGARGVSLLLLIVGLVAAAGASAGAAGRWKLGDDGSCYFDENDGGPDQCSPQPGRWKLGGDGSCYFDATDEGPNQCTPSPQSASESVEQSEPLSGTLNRPALEPAERLERPYRRGSGSHCGCRTSFCTRQFVSSPTNSSFSVRQSIALTRPSSFGCLPALPNLPTIRPVELELVDRRIVHSVGIAGVRAVEIWMRSARDAERRRHADVRDLRLEGAVAVEDLDPLVALVGDVDVALAHRWQASAACRTGPARFRVEPHDEQEPSVPVELRDACVRRRDRRRRRCCRRASQATSLGRVN